MKQEIKSKEEKLSRFIIRLQGKIYKRRYLLGVIILSLVLIIMFFGFFKMIFFLSLLLVLNIGSSFIAKHIPRAHTSIELIMFSTVLAGLAYGSRVGAFFGILSAILYYYAIGRFSYYVTVFAPLYALVGIIAPFFSKIPILELGMTFTIGYLLISSVIVFVLFNARMYKMAQFAIINIPFNFIMFKYFAPIFLLLM